MPNPLSQYLMIGKLVALLGCIALICWQSSQIHRWHKQAVGLSAKLEALSTAKNEQQIVTRDNIKVVTKLVHDADGKAKAVEQAPVPGGCVTKPEVMNADI
jgi:hypothetical protein